MSTLFTKIINRELPSYTIYEDELTFSFLALDQVNLGHTLVIPKKEVDHFIDADEPEYNAVFGNAKVIGQAIRAATDCKRVAAVIAGFEVPHFHLHLIPAWSIGDISFAKAKRHSEDEMRQVQKQIRTELHNLKLIEEV